MSANPKPIASTKPTYHTVPGDGLIDEIKACYSSGANSVDEVLSMIVKRQGEAWVKKMILVRWKVILRAIANDVRGVWFRQTTNRIRFADDSESEMAAAKILDLKKWVSPSRPEKAFKDWTVEDLQASENYYRKFAKVNLMKASMLKAVRLKLQRSGKPTVGEGLNENELRQAFARLFED